MGGAKREVVECGLDEAEEVAIVPLPHAGFVLRSFGAGWWCWQSMR